MHPELILAKQLAYDPIGLAIDHFTAEVESKEYGASEFQISDHRVKFRVAKITPTKVGQFVTFWKRIGDGPIQPLDFSDPFDLLVVSVRARDHFGQFAFSKSVLYDQGIISKDEKGGKRAIRVYPPWDEPDSQQARKTQKWQCQYFLEIPFNKETEASYMQKLFTL